MDEAAKVIFKAMYVGSLRKSEVDTFDKVGGREIMASILNSKDFEAETQEATNKAIGDFADTIGLAKARTNVSKTVNAETGQEIYIKKIKSIDNGSMIFELEDGNTIDSKNVEYKSEDEAIIYESVVSMGYNVQEANVIISGYNTLDGVSASDYVLGVNEAYKYGKIGYPIKRIKTNGFYNKLTDEQKLFAYDLGRKSANDETKITQAEIDKNKTHNTKKKGKIHITPSVSTMTERQKASLAVLGRVVADTTHNDVYIYESIEKNGKRVFSDDIAGYKAGENAPNGFYDPGTGAIYIDLHAGNNGEGVILWTAAHELTHFVRQWSPEKFKVLADFLMAEYGKKGVNIEVFIQNQIDKAKASGRDISFDAAYEEVVADSLQQMFTDTNLAEKFAKLKTQDKTLWEKIRDFFAELHKRITELYKGLEPQSEEAKLVREMKEPIGNISDLFAEALVEAGGTFAATETRMQFDELNSETKHSERTFSYDELIAKADLRGVVIRKSQHLKITDGIIDSGWVLEKVRKKCKTLTTKARVAHYINVPDIGRNVEVTGDGVTHGFNRPNDKRYGKSSPKAIINAKVALELPQILNNSIEVNRSRRGNNIDVPFTHILIGTVALENDAGDFEYYAVRSMVQERKNQNPVLVEANILGKLTSVNAKKIGSPTAQVDENIVAVADGEAYRYSVADLLNDVKSEFVGTFSENVYQHLGTQRKNEKGFTEHLLYSERNSDATDSRTLLANALESATTNSVEKEWLDKYKSQISSLNKDQAELTKINAEIKNIRFTKGTDRNGLAVLENKAKILAGRINRTDKRLLNLEASQPLRNVLEREKTVAIKKAKAKERKFFDEYKEKSRKNLVIPRIETMVISLQKRLEHPSAKNAIPEAFGKSVAKLLSVFDFTTFDKDGNAKYTKANISREEARQSLAELAEQLGQNSIESMYGQLDISPDMKEWIKQMADYFDAASHLARDGFVVHKMSEKELKLLHKFLHSLQTTINKAGKYYTSMSSNVESDAISTIEHLDSLTTRKHNEMLEKLGKVSAWDLATPTTVFDRFGEGGKNVLKMLTKGQAKMAFNVQEITDFVKDAYTEDEAKAWQNDIVTVTIDGKEYDVTVEMLMGLHCLLHQKDSRRHILEGGGIRFGDVKIKGKITRFTNTFFSLEDELEIEKKLAKIPRAKEVSEKMQKFMATTGSEWGNEISMTRFGYHAFTVPDYYPIRTIAAGSEYEAQQQRANIYALLNKSFTKERTPNADNAVVVDGIFSVFNNHMAEMALYNAWSLPVIDTIKWFNYKVKQDVDAKSPEKSVHESFRLAYGNYADEYVRRLLESINSQTAGGLSEGPAFYGLRMVNRVAVSGNIRVAVQQPFSITRAFELISPKYVITLKGDKYKVAHEEMLGSAGIALWKSMGYYDVDVSRPLEVKVKKNAKFADKVTEKTMKLSELGDSLTWTTLWNACKLETAEKNPGVNSKKLLEKTEERFNDIILRTQVVDSVLAKSQWMRSNSFWHRSMSAFMSEPLTSYNVLLRQYDKYSRDVVTYGTKVAFKKNGRGIAVAVGVFVLSQILNALVTAPIDAARDDDDYETYLEKLLSNFKENTIRNLLPHNMIPFVSDIFDYAVYGRTDRADLQFFINGIDLGKNIYETVTEYSYFKLHKTLLSALTVTSSVVGMPISNITRDAISMWNTVIAGNLGAGELKFQTAEDSHTVGYQNMYKALLNDDEERAGYLYAQLQSNYVESDDIYSGLVKLVKQDYLDDKLSGDEVTTLLTTISYYTEKEVSNDALYWQIDKWNYAKNNDSSDGYSKYNDLYSAVETGENLEKTIKHYTDNGVEEKTLVTQITKHFKPVYLRAYDDGDNKEMARIRKLLYKTGLYGKSVNQVISTCNDWIKQNKDN